MDAATMWFDSTLTFLDLGVKHETVAAAAKLLGFIERDKGNFEEATKKFELTRKLFADWGARPSESIDIESAWASTAIRAGADPEACYRSSRNAVDRLNADSVLLKRWSYAYLIYLNHAQVLSILGRLDDSEKHAKLAADFCGDRGDEGGRAFVQLKTAEMQVKAGQHHRAKAILRESLAVFAKTEHLDHQVEAYRYLEEIYEAEGDYAKSLENSRKGRDADLLLAESRRAEQLLAARRDFGISEAESKTLLAQEMATRAELEREKANSNQYALLAGILCIALVLVYAMQRLRYRSQRQVELEHEVANRTAELAAKTERLEASNQELEKFAYIASHDMKTPLRNVTSFLGLIQLRLPESARPAVGEYVELAQGYARSMHTLVTDVLEFSKLNVDLAELSAPFNVRSLCDELIAKRSQDLSSTGARIDLFGSALINAPASFVEQVIGNLIDNGLKYNESLTPRVSVTLSDSDEEVKIVVSDNGIGIAAEYQDRIFELFKRLHTSDEYAGTGLGLASSKKIAERLGGGLTLKSELGKGSVFTVTLPKVFRAKSRRNTISKKNVVDV
ncbi:MAG: ATP-binding protein [Saprospiraceae bacterium]